MGRANAFNGVIYQCVPSQLYPVHRCCVLRFNFKSIAAHDVMHWWWFNRLKSVQFLLHFICTKFLHLLSQSIHTRASHLQPVMWLCSIIILILLLSVAVIGVFCVYFIFHDFTFDVSFLLLLYSNLLAEIIRFASLGRCACVSTIKSVTDVFHIFCLINFGIDCGCNCRRDHYRSSSTAQSNPEEIKETARKREEKEQARVTAVKVKD